MEYIIVFAIIAGLSFALISKAKHSYHNRRLRDELKARESELDSRDQYIKQRDKAFKKDFCTGRHWLAEFVAEAEKAVDSSRERYLHTKSHPAHKAAEIVAQVKQEKRSATTQLKFVEYQLKSYEEYFPFLEDFREVILEERVPLGAKKNNIESLESADPALQHISREEWESLSETNRNQLALDRYMLRPKSNWEIGILYERYIGYLRENRGWRVVFHGAIKGYEDFGRDLICKKANSVEIIQAKCWSRTKTIHEKHIFQLYATCVHYGLEHPNLSITPIFSTTTGLSTAAKLVAETLGVSVEHIDLPKHWPIIKCNVNPSTGERIYHLPFDQQYDRTVIGAVAGECYVSTVEEAEALGFRRAFRYGGPFTS